MIFQTWIGKQHAHTWTWQHQSRHYFKLLIMQRKLQISLTVRQIISACFAYWYSDMKVLEKTVELLTELAKGKEGKKRICNISPKSCAQCTTLNMFLLLAKYPSSSTLRCLVQRFFETYTHSTQFIEPHEIKTISSCLSKYSLSEQVRSALYRNDCPPLCISVSDVKQVYNCLELINKVVNSDVHYDYPEHVASQMVLSNQIPILKSVSTFQKINYLRQKNSIKFSFNKKTLEFTPQFICFCLRFSILRNS